MKNLVKLFVVIVIVALSSQSYAQRAGIILGLNLSNLNVKDDNNNISKDSNYRMNPGIHLGFVVDIPVYKFLSFETGLLITTKGYKSENDLPSSTKEKISDYLFFIDLPLTIKGTIDLEAVKLYAGIGPYLSLGVYGIRVRYIDNPIKKDTTSHTIKWGSGGLYDQKRFDMGLTFGGGVEIGPVPIFLRVSYDLGLLNIASYSTNGFSAKSGVLKISLGYMFRGKDKSSDHKKSRRR